MTTRPPKEPTPAAKAPYRAPVLERFGSVVDHTKARSSKGAMDGAPMSLRTG